MAFRDLASRLRALPVVTLAPPDDALLRAVMVKLFADRQLDVDERWSAILLTASSARLPARKAAVDALDHEAMRQQRPVTRALAAELFRATAPLDAMSSGACHPTVILSPN